MADETQETTGAPASARPDLSTVRTEYQVPADEVVQYRPRVFGAVDLPFTEDYEVSVTKTEAQLLDQLTFDRGLLGLREFEGISKEAFRQAESEYPDNTVPAGVPADREWEWQGNDGHRDAFRHTYWSARLSQEYGPEWARAFTTAHEGLPGNIANREAMDLYNNSVGIEIGAQHPDASPSELAALVREAVTQGKSVVMDGSGNLEWSDRVRVGEHGLSPNDVIGPNLPTPQVVSTKFAALEPELQAPGAQGVQHASANTHASDLSPLAQTLLTDAERHVRQFCEANGLPWDQGMENSVAALACRAGEGGMTGIDHLTVRDGNILICQDDGYGLKTESIPAQTAANTTVEESMRGLNDVERLAAVEQAQRDTALAQDRDEPSYAMAMNA
ncbi:XVIPCD domain-containing protein [Hydrogenophaga sp. 5NK40-0174]|uniref:DUF6973 domain-containing protein n=1 Tax=Hydrogenophaga sp. 5NK40-0174 TaxID=3127649 RepID=UPI0031099718